MERNATVIVLAQMQEEKMPGITEQMDLYLNGMRDGILKAKDKARATRFENYDENRKIMLF